MTEEHVRLIPRSRLVELREMIAYRIPTSELPPEEQDEDPPLDLNDPELARLLEGLDLSAPKEPNRLPLDVEIFTTFRDCPVMQSPSKNVKYFDGEIYAQRGGGPVWVYEWETTPVSYTDDDGVMQFSASPRLVQDHHGNYKEKAWINEVPSYSTDVNAAKSFRNEVLGVDRLLGLTELYGEMHNSWKVDIRDTSGNLICSGANDSCARAVLDAVLNALLTDPSASIWYRAV